MRLLPIALLLALGLPPGTPRLDPVVPIGTVVASGDFRWPLDGPPVVVRLFDPPSVPWAAGHRGVDLAASPGAVVRSAGPGVVSFAGRIAGRGVVTVAHAGGLRTTYEPVDASLRAGTSVAAGDRIGVLAPGHPGCPAVACLHWGLRQGERYLDPLSLLGMGRLRLLPVQERSASTAGRPWASRSYSSARL